MATRISILPRRSSSSSRRRCRRSRRSRTQMPRASGWSRPSDRRRPHASCRRGGGKARSRRAHRGSAGERVSHVGLGWRPDVSLLGGRAFLLIALGDGLPRAPRWLPRHGRALRHRRARGNLPVICGLLSLWYRDFMGAETIAVVPYSHALRLLPAYLQQLWMESNGKSVTTAGEPVAVDSGSVLWGGAGTNTQHAVFQLLHQGTVLVPVDLIGFARSSGMRRSGTTCWRRTSSRRQRRSPSGARRTSSKTLEHRRRRSRIG